MTFTAGSDFLFYGNRILGSGANTLDLGESTFPIKATYTNNLVSYTTLTIPINNTPNTADGSMTWDGTNNKLYVGDGTTAIEIGPYTDADVSAYLNGNLDNHIIPDTNATYDIGSAEYKIRHLYLSDNSIYMGDNDVPITLTADKLTVDGHHVKDTSTVAPDNGAAIDITKSNHFVTAGETYTLLDGTYIGQELKFWRTNGTGHVDINVNSISYVDAGNVTTSGNIVMWRLGDAHVGMYSCIWTGTYWHWANGQLA